jgi:hypothetical protein
LYAGSKKDVFGLPPVRMQAAQRETVARFRSKPGRSYKKEEL